MTPGEAGGGQATAPGGRSGQQPAGSGSGTGPRPAPSRPDGSPDPRAVAAVRDAAALAALALAVVAFSGGWDAGSLAVDGPGTRLWVQHALDLWREMGAIPYWIDAMWAGTPAWGLTPSLPVLWLLPLAGAVGPAAAVKIASLAAQVVGAWGCFVLVRSLWGGTAAPMVAGVAYGLSPLFVAHVGVFGLEPVAWVLAATPWFAWALRRALESGGRRYVAAASAAAAFAVLQQAEHAYGLALLGAAFVVVAVLGQRRHGAPVPAVLWRAAAVVGLALGLCAFWLLPLTSLREGFVFTPPDLVRFHLTEGLGGEFARSGDAFVARAPSGVAALSGVEDRLRVLGDHGYYLGGVALALAGLALLLGPRHDREGYMTATVAASALSVWTSTAGVPLVRSELLDRGGIAAMVVIGAAGGLLVGSLALRARSVRARVVVAAGGAALLASAPFLTPFLVLRRVVPLLSSIRFPRLYVVAILGVAVAAAFPLALARRWLERNRVRGRPIAIAAVAIASAGLLLVDVHPYREAYRIALDQEQLDSFDAVAAWLGEHGDGRVGTQSFGQPLLVEALLASGRPAAVGWPHPIAARGVWAVTGRLEHAEPEHARRGQGLAGATHLVAEPAERLGPGESRVDGMRVAPVREPLPAARLYDRAVMVADDVLAGDLAVALAPAGTAVVTDEAGVSERLEGLVAAAVADTRPCPPPAADAARLPAEIALEAGTGGSAAGIAGEVASACALQAWLGLPHDPSPGAEQARTIGGTVRALVDGLTAISVSLDRPPGPTRMALQELRPDGTLGSVVREATMAERDRYGLYRFAFDPVAGSAGSTYAFTLSCPECGEGGGPRIRTVPPLRSPGDLLVDGRRDGRRVTVAMPVYDEVEEQARPDGVTSAQRAGPGRWVVQTAAPQRSLLVVSSAWFPGWSATIDREPARVLRADSGFVGVPLEAGPHEVRLVWTPPVAVPVGRVVTALTMVALLALVAVPKRVWDRLGVASWHEEP